MKSNHQSHAPKRCVFAAVGLVAMVWALSAQATELTFVAAEKDGAKVWEGGGTIDGKSPATLKVKNPLTAEHGFAIDTMRVKEVIKAGEEKTITVKPENIDKSAKEHRVYCHLHPKHGPATIKVSGN